MQHDFIMPNTQTAELFVWHMQHNEAVGKTTTAACCAIADGRVRVDCNFRTHGELRWAKGFAAGLIAANHLAPAPNALTIQGHEQESGHPDIAIK